MSSKTWESQRLVLWALGEPKFDGRVLAVLAAHADVKKRTTWVGQQTVAAILYRLPESEVADWHIKRVSEAAKRLEKKGLLEIKRNAHRCADGTFTNLYRLLCGEFLDSPERGESLERGDSPERGLTDSPERGPADSPEPGGQTTSRTTRENHQHVRTWGEAPLARRVPKVVTTGNGR